MTTTRTPTRRSTARRAAIAAVLLGVVVGIAVTVAVAAAGPPAPSITASPVTSPTSSNTMTLSFTSGGATGYLCSLDGAAYAACTSPETYGSPTALAEGAHTFRVKALDKKGIESGVSEHPWVLDRTRPTLVSIVRAGPTPTNASSVSWTVTFSEPVQNVVAARFALAASGLAGSPAITGVSGSGAAWTVTASTGTGTSSLAGTLGLALASAGAVADVACNALLAPTLPVAGVAYAIDKQAPALQFTQTPPDPDTTATASLGWSQSPADPHFDRFECSVENGPFTASRCVSPFVVDTSNNGQHQFAVRAYDTAGNANTISYKWKVEKGSRQDFTIGGGATGPLYPGGAPTPIALVLRNPNAVPITITSLTVTVVGTGLPAGCSSSAFQITQSNVATHNLVVPANSSVTLPSGSTTAPAVTMTDTGSSQNACRNATVSFAYSGSAQS